jgi:endo-1,4-beta-xylanase
MRSLVGLLTLRLLAAAQSGPVEQQLYSLLPAGSEPNVVIGDADPLGWAVAGATAQLVEVAPDAGVPATMARRIRVAAATNPPWNAALRSRVSTGAIRRNDVVLASFWLRTVSETPRQSSMYFVAELPRSPFTGILGGNIGAGPQWTQILLSGRSTADFAPGDIRFTFQLGNQAQAIEVAGMVLLNLGPNANPDQMPFTRITYEGRAADAPWREEAQRRIERYRMANLKVRVVDAEGNPVPEASVAVKMTRRAFGVGSFLEAFTARRTPEEQAQELDIFRRLFNRGTAPIYWADWGWPSRKPQYLQSAAWLAENKMLTRGHTMIYPTWQYMPAAVRPLQSNPEALRQRMLEQVREISEATREFGFREYDVTNELRQLTEVINIVGRDAIVEWFAEARRLLPNARMTLNENQILTNGGATELNQQNLLSWYKFLDEKGQAPDVLGLQGHMGIALTPPERVWEILDRFQNETRAELQITEYDLDTRDEETQAEYTRDFFTACFAHPAITGITMWGFWGEMMYVPNGAFYRKDFTPKPNGRMLEELLTKTWWTNKEGQSNEEGRYDTKAFLGTLEVIVRRGDVETRSTVELSEPNADREVSITLP